MLSKFLQILRQLILIGAIGCLLGCGAIVGAGNPSGGDQPASMGGAVGEFHSTGSMTGEASAEGGSDAPTQAGSECSGGVCNVDTPIGYFPNQE